MRVRNTIKVRTVVTKEGKVQEIAGSVQRVWNDATNIHLGMLMGKGFN